MTEWDNKKNPVIFCLHGLGGSSLTFIEVADKLKDEYRFVTCFVQLTNQMMFTIAFSPAITNFTIDNRTYIWYNRNILLETLYIMYEIHVIR
ncbi:alpha/beta hydrolase [Bacillus mycoides]|nr:alpha/beta hydrolase [Bacillus mycoides]QWH14955.1 alpha/beta hydrolase [Bacillus mycoides]TBX77470.1 alpha/beta hydrolase [Bacillus mycoides]